MINLIFWLRQYRHTIIQLPFEHFKCNRVAFEEISPTFVLINNISYEHF